MKDRRKELYEEAIDQWGEEAQIDMLIEEMAELTQALIKRKRKINGSTDEDIKSEYIDVDVMMDQAKIILFDSEMEHREMKRGSLMHLKEMLEGSDDDEVEEHESE